MFKSLTMFSVPSSPEMMSSLLNNSWITQTMSLCPEPLSLGKSVVSASGFTAISDVMLEQCTDPMAGWYLPLNMVILEKAIDKAALKFETDKRAREIGEMEGRVVGKNEKSSIKDTILANMILTAPTKRKVIPGYLIDDGDELVLMAGATGNKAAEYRDAVMQMFSEVFTTMFQQKLVGDDGVVNRMAISEITSLSSNSFCVSLGEDQDLITIEECSELPDELADRIEHGQFVWIQQSLAEICTCRFTVDQTFKKIQWGDLEKAPGDKGDNYSSAMNRLEFKTYLSIFQMLKDKVGEPE